MGPWRKEGTMKKTTKKLAGLLAILMFVGLVLVNVQVLLGSASADDVVAEPAYKWKYVANEVWHCTNGDTMRCDTESSHSWKDPQPEEL